jgi:hypothetical protein
VLVNILLRAIIRVWPRHPAIEVAHHIPVGKKLLNGRNIGLYQRRKKKTFCVKGRNPVHGAASMK